MRHGGYFWVSIPAMLSVDIQLIKSWWLAACQLSAEMSAMSKSENNSE